MAKVRKVGSLFMGPSSCLFSCRKKPAETGQPDGYISTRYTDKEGDNMCTRWDTLVSKIFTTE